MEAVEKTLLNSSVFRKPIKECQEFCILLRKAQMTDLFWLTGTKAKTEKATQMALKYLSSSFPAYFWVSYFPYQWQKRAEKFSYKWLPEQALLNYFKASAFQILGKFPLTTPGALAEQSGWSCYLKALWKFTACSHLDMSTSTMSQRDKEKWHLERPVKPTTWTPPPSLPPPHSYSGWERLWTLSNTWYFKLFLLYTA